MVRNLRILNILPLATDALSAVEDRPGRIALDGQRNQAEEGCKQQESQYGGEDIEGPLGKAAEPGPQTDGALGRLLQVI
jgi:hypothetical protein